MEKIFYYDECRPVKIKIDKAKDYISFHFPNEEDREFYWIGIEDWKIPSRHWEDHMARKGWYCEQMTEFINRSIV